MRDTTQYGRQQYLNESTYILDHHRSCIHLIVPDQRNLEIDTNIHPLLPENCHHQIIYSTFDLKIFYPLPYERTVWHYQYANTDLTNRSLENLTK